MGGVFRRGVMGPTERKSARGSTGKSIVKPAGRAAANACAESIQRTPEEVHRLFAMLQRKILRPNSICDVSTEQATEEPVITAARSLKYSADGSSIPAEMFDILRAYTEHQSWEINLRAIIAIGVLGDKRAAPIFERAWNSRSFRIKKAVVFAIGHTGWLDAKERLLAMRGETRNEELLLAIDCSLAYIRNTGNR